MKGSQWTMIMNLQEDHTHTPLHPLSPSLLGKPNFPLPFPSLPFSGAFTKVLAGCWVRTSIRTQKVPDFTT